MKYIALRETPKGYKLTELSIKKCYHGEYRKYSHDFELVYKRWQFAKDKCISFFKHVYRNMDVEIKYYGTITNEIFRGEVASEKEFNFLDWE